VPQFHWWLHWEAALSMYLVFVYNNFFFRGHTVA
jgi:hypothetical protein